MAGGRWPVAGGAWPVPENPQMEPIWVRANERGFALKGVAVGVIRAGGV